MPREKKPEEKSHVTQYVKDNVSATDFFLKCFANINCEENCNQKVVEGGVLVGSWPNL